MPVCAFGFNGFKQIINEPAHSVLSPCKLTCDPTDDVDIFCVSWDTICMRICDQIQILGIYDSNLSNHTDGNVGNKTLTVNVSNNSTSTLSRMLQPYHPVSVSFHDNCLYCVKDDGTASVFVKCDKTEEIKQVLIEQEIDKSQEIDKFRSLSCGDLYHVIISEDGRIGSIKKVDDGFIIQPISMSVKVKSVSCGKEHVMMLSQLGVVYSYGLGGRGQLGHGQMPEPKLETPTVIEALQGVAMVTISAGGWHSAAVSEFGDLYVWGWNESGQLGFPCKTLQSESTDVSVVTIQNLPCLLDLGGEELNVACVSCGSRHTACVTECGQLFTWGWNAYGQLGHGDKTSRDVPTPVTFQGNGEAVSQDFLKSVTFVSNHGVTVQNVKCGAWNTVIVVQIH